MPETQKRPVRFRERSPFSWFYDESWWKDIVGNALSGVIVVLVGIGTAVATGWIGSPENQLFVAGISSGLMFLIFAAAAYYHFVQAFNREATIRQGFVPEVRVRARIAAGVIAFSSSVLGIIFLIPFVLISIRLLALVPDMFR